MSRWRGAERTDEYRVEHPKWELFEIPEYNINVDFGAVYGEKFAVLREQFPFSVIMAKGSDISVYKGKAIR